MGCVAQGLPHLFFMNISFLLHWHSLLGLMTHNVASRFFFSLTGGDLKMYFNSQRTMGKWRALRAELSSSGTRPLIGYPIPCSQPWNHIYSGNTKQTQHVTLCIYIEIYICICNSNNLRRLQIKWRLCKELERGEGEGTWCNNLQKLHVFILYMLYYYFT